jgi:uncharacterized protein (TIGR01777 family)
MPQRVAITGSSGLIGGALSAFLTARGDEVVHLVRRPARNAAEVAWNPADRHLDPGSLDDVDAVVNLAGAGVGDHRWTPSYKQQILASRVDATYTVASALAERGGTARLVSASAVGYYGDRGDEVLTEESGPGEGYFPEVVAAWEAAADPARDAGIPVAHVRSGIVLSGRGGALEPMLRLGRLGLGGPLGSGRQYMPWITLRDEVAAIAFLVDHPEITGPVNLTGPEPSPQREIAAELGRQLHRPAFLPAPGFAIRTVLGEFAQDVLASLRVVPNRLVAQGFVHQDATLEQAIAWALGS